MRILERSSFRPLIHYFSHKRGIFAFSQWKWHIVSHTLTCTLCQVKSSRCVIQSTSKWNELKVNCVRVHVKSDNVLDVGWCAYQKHGLPSLGWLISNLFIRHFLFILAAVAAAAFLPLLFITIAFIVVDFVCVHSLFRFSRWLACFFSAFFSCTSRPAYDDVCDEVIVMLYDPRLLVTIVWIPSWSVCKSCTHMRTIYAHVSPVPSAFKVNLKTLLRNVFETLVSDIALLSLLRQRIILINWHSKYRRASASSGNASSTNDASE